MTVDPILTHIRKEGRTTLTEVESKQFLERAGIPIVATKQARTEEEAIHLSMEMGFPVAMKIISPEITHKSDSGGVKLGLKNVDEVKGAYEQIMRSVKSYNPAARIEGVSIQKMARPGREIIIGMSKDPQFGPLLMFGIGGVMVEVMKDVAFRLAPLRPRDAHEMIMEIKGYSLLTGFRGAEAVDIPFLERLLVKVSDLTERYPEIKEFDLNPVMANKDGAVVVDSRIVLEDKN